MVKAKACRKCGEMKMDIPQNFEPQPKNFCSRAVCRDCRRAYHRVKATQARGRLTAEERRERGRQNYLQAKAKRKVVAIAPEKAVLRQGLNRREAFGSVPVGLQGIYQIQHRVTGQVYVGSGRSIRNRWSSHVYMLEHGKHHSPRLQHAWNRDGIEAFSFTVLEAVKDIHMLLTIEQAWIEFLGGHTTRGGYNCRSKVERTIGRILTDTQKEMARLASKKKAKPYLITWPDGRTERANSLTDFCVQRHLSHTGMRSAANGRQLYHGIWVRRADGSQGTEKPTPYTPSPEHMRRFHEASAAAQRKSYEVTTPEGQVIQVSNMNEFAARHGISSHGLRRVARNPQRYLSHKGYSARLL